MTVRRIGRNPAEVNIGRAHMGKTWESVWNFWKGE